MELEPEYINEAEILLDPLDRAIAMEEYFQGRAPKSWSTSGVNLIDTAQVVAKKPKAKTGKKELPVWVYIILGVSLLLVTLAIVYIRIRN